MVLQYIVKRERQGYDCYGLVDAQAIKRQRLGGGTAAQAELPAGLTQAMVCSQHAVLLHALLLQSSSPANLFPPLLPCPGNLHRSCRQACCRRPQL